MVLPGTSAEQFPFHIDSSGNDKLIYLRPMPADFDFLSTMQMHLVDGSLYASNDSMCYNSILINETAAGNLDFENPLGMKLMGFGMNGEEIEYTIRGIVQDYHYESLHHKIQPLAITLLHEKDHAQYLSVRISGEDMPGTMEYIQQNWGEFVNNEPFDYYFMNRNLDGQYNQEETTAHIFTIFFLISIFIAILGLFGLASHTAEQKTKEIGIRKAMGASTPRITLMLSAQFTTWVIWANILAFPIAYAGLKLWLSRFAYHINIEAWLFFIAATGAIIIALVTVSFQAIRSARANPVEALQYE
jgi:putative ABC transport system permease protein